MTEQSRTRRLIAGALAMGAMALFGLPASGQVPRAIAANGQGRAAGKPVASAVAAPEMIRWSHNVAKDSKPVVLWADEMATWAEGGGRIILLKGRVWIEEGVVQIRMPQAVIWVDEEAKKRTGIYRLEIYGEGGVSVDDGPKSLQGNRALVDLSTRGEVRLRAYSNKVIQRPLPREPLYLRAQASRFSTGAPVVAIPSQNGGRDKVGPANGPIQRISYQVPPDGIGPRGLPVLPAQGPRPPLDWPPPEPSTGPGTPGPPGSPPAVTPPSVLPPGTIPPGAGPVQGPPGAPPAMPPLPPPGPALPPVPPPAAVPPEGPPRQISIVPRSSNRIQSQSFPQPNGETAVVVSSGVILTVRNGDGKVGLIDIEADRLVFWTKGDSANVFNQLRSPEGKTGKAMEFYLAGNVEIREQSGTDNKLLRADEVYYDVGRNVAVAVRADLEINRKGIPEPVHVRAEEIHQESPTRFHAFGAQVFASRLPSDPGLKVVVRDGVLYEKKTPKVSIFGRQFIDSKTGQPEIDTLQIFEGRNATLEVENVPVLWFPYLKGDINDPLGPLRSLTFNYNRVYGFQVMSTFGVYDLLGIDKLPGTNWNLLLDYMSARGPAIGTNFDYAGKGLLGVPNIYVGQVKAYFMDDTGQDILGGGRGPNDHHPELRGRFFWRQDVQDLPYGFSVQSQVSYLSDHNFLEQFYKMEYDQQPNQETFLYVKQQNNNWAWTGLVEPRIRNFVTETEWLPRADGYLIGESFFDALTYNAHASAGYAMLRLGQIPPLPVTVTDRNLSTARFDLWQELSAPFNLGPVRVAPYLIGDLTYYTEDLTGSDRGRLYGAAGLRASMPLSRVYPEAQNDYLNINGINHKIVLSSNYYYAQTDTPYTRLPQLDRLDDDPTDQARRDIDPLQPLFNPRVGTFLATSPLFDPQIYAIRRLVENKTDTLSSIDVLQMDVRQRLQTKRGFAGQEHIVDWMTLDLSASFFPQSRRDNFNESFGFLEYDYTWNVGDRTALFSTGWYDPIDNGARVVTVGALLNRPDRLNYYIGYRQIDPIASQLVTGAVTYVFSPKYSISTAASYDFGNTKGHTATIVLTRMGRDVQVSIGLGYNAALNTVNFSLEILPGFVTPRKALAGLMPIAPLAMAQ